MWHREWQTWRSRMGLKVTSDVVRENTSLHDENAKLKAELDDAYAEMYRQSPAITAVFVREVWKRVARWGISKGFDVEHDENCGAIHFPNGRCTCGRIDEG